MKGNEAVVMDKNTAKEIALSGCLHLANRVDEKGKFAYLIDEHGDIFPKYNSLRHAGAIWSMKQVLREYPIVENFPESSVISGACNRATMFFVKNFIIRIPTVAFVKDKKMEYKFKLGGNALAILALLDDENYKELVDDLVKGMESFWVEKHLYSVFDAPTGIFQEFESEYYPGEVAFAFALSSLSYDGDKRSFRIVKYLREGRDKEVQVIRDHWLLQAIEILYENEKCFTYKDIYLLEYAKRIAGRIIGSESDYIGRCTPMACMVEGLISYYNMTKDKVILKFIEEMLDKVAKYQIKDGKLTGAFFDSGVSRIDYCQHSISAFLRYSLLKEDTLR